MKITNVHGISLPMAVWLLHDTYDYVNQPNYISATSLLRSTKQLILSKRVEASDNELDISEKIASSLGTAIHDSIEKAWQDAGPAIMKKLGYPEKIYSNIVVNPGDNYLAEHPECIPVYFEKRGYKEITINGVTYTVGGKFDTVIDNKLFDYKSTSTFALKGNKDNDYGMQGGIYRWINPELILDDYIYINFIFTDWVKYRTREEGYPQTRVMEYPVIMPSLEDTENFIRAKLIEYHNLKDRTESEIPDCTDKELWRSEPKYKYYSDPTKTDGKSTKNLDTLAEANAFLAEKGKGIVKVIPGEVKACGYCPAYPVCKQREQYDI